MNAQYRTIRAWVAHLNQCGFCKKAALEKNWKARLEMRCALGKELREAMISARNAVKN